MEFRTRTYCHNGFQQILFHRNTFTGWHNDVVGICQYHADIRFVRMDLGRSILHFRESSLVCIMNLESNGGRLSLFLVFTQTMHTRHQSTNSPIKAKQMESLRINIKFTIQDALPGFHFRS